MPRRTVSSVLGNAQRLDGGAMFGNAPKALWQRWIAPDEHNRISLACRAMLVEETDDEGRVRRILFETGIGCFFSPKLRERFGVYESEHVLLESLARLGLGDDDIDVVVLSHLHFDHAGGLFGPYREGEPLRLLFPRARFVVGARAYARAVSPHPRDRSSFIPELPSLLEASGRLECVEGERSEVLGPHYLLHTSEGHTPGLVLTEVPSADDPIVFAADLIPGRPWLHVPITMGYDRAPEQLVDEKQRLLEALAARGGRFFFTHDPSVSMSRVVRDESGRFSAGESWESLVRAPI
jgi:glyoxylase-like metal-dependent hydrolase (beta-lactamase superfamily II)